MLALQDYACCGLPLPGLLLIPQYYLVLFSCVIQPALLVAWAGYAVTYVMLPCNAVAINKQPQLHAENVQPVFVLCLPA